jgi:hypothetical protein
MPTPSLIRAALSLLALLVLFTPAPASAWGFEGHRVVGSIADELLLNTNAARQVQNILNEGEPNGTLTLRLVGPWADCVKSVELKDGNFRYVVHEDSEAIRYEVPCTLFSRVDRENKRMVDYVIRNWSNCTTDPAKPQTNCHANYHFDDVAIQRDRFDRSEQGTNDHDVVAAIGAAIAMLRGQPVPPPFSIKDKKEALMLLVHFLGDLHQPLHVGSIYLDGDGKMVDPDAAHAIDPATFTVGGNAIQDQNVNLHAEWDDIPFDLGDAWTRELLTAARAVPATDGGLEEWPATWATDTLHIARQAFADLHFQRTDPPPKVKWSLTFENHTAYLLIADSIKRRQLAKGGGHLAEILRKIWP